MNSKKIIIAIDGYSSSGKSSMAKRLAAEIGYRYIDSGAMYRAVTLYVMRKGMIDAIANSDFSDGVSIGIYPVNGILSEDEEATPQEEVWGVDGGPGPN